MKKKLLALALVLLMLPAAAAFAAEAGWADLLMEEIYAVVGGDETLTIRSHVVSGGQGGYSHALYAVELTGDETKEELDAMAVELLENDVKPVWGGSKHCYHGGAHTVDPEYTIRAEDWAPGSYLYVCYAFGCEGGSYNHYLIPYYEQLSTMSIRINAESRGLELCYTLVDEQGVQIASFEDGGGAELDLNGDPVYLQIQSDVEYPNERIVSVEAGSEAVTFDAATMELDPVLCGSGSISVTIRSWLTGQTRTETVYLNVPCAPVSERTVVRESTCTEDGLSALLCHGYGVSCETIFDEMVLPAQGHQVDSVSQYVVEPTATRPGVGMGTCVVCGDSDAEKEVPPIFSDVVSNGFYSRALDHCYDKGWVTGITANTFAPGNECVRAQVVTFLWRAAGCPETEQKVNPFVDVKKGSYYYKAVLWAVEQGITTGTDATHFSPKSVCSRAQVVTFLWRAFGQPQSSAGEHPFKDVKAGKWYEKSVVWAVEEGITSGMTATTFAPNQSCSRAQIVTFLFRAYAE